MDKAVEVKKVIEPKLHLRDMLSLSLRVFRVRPARTLLTIMGISLGIGVVLFLVSLGSGLQYILLGKLASTEDSLRSVEVYYPTESSLPIQDADINKIKAFTETNEISPIVELSGEVKNDNYSGFVMFKVIQPNFFRLSGSSPDIGQPLVEGEDGVVISSTALRLLNLSETKDSIGKKLNLTIFYQANSKSPIETIAVPNDMPIKGITVDESSSPYVYVPARFLEGHSLSYNRMFVKAGTLEQVPALSDKLITQGFVISARLDLVNQARKAMQVITIILGVFGATALVVSAIGMFNTMLISFLERVFEIGIMKSLGATSENIRNLILTESFVVGLLGGVGGVVSGIVAGQAINLAFNWFISRYGATPVTLFIYPPQFIITIIVISGFVGVSAGLWPAHKAVQLSPKQAFARQ